MFILLEERPTTQIKDIKSTKYSNQCSGYVWISKMYWLVLIENYTFP